MRRVTDKHLNKLRKMADKAADAQYKFQLELDRIKQMQGWAQACEAQGVCPRANAGDWMA